jgi:hypothetical protein
MSKIADLIAAEVAAAEESDSIDQSLPSNVRVSRGHDRSRVLQVRLNEDEYRLIEKLASENLIPVSTYARSILLRTIGV